MSLIFWQAKFQNKDQNAISCHPLDLLLNPFWVGVFLFSTLEKKRPTPGSDWDILNDQKFGRIKNILYHRLLALPRIRILDAIDKLFLFEVQSKPLNYLASRKATTAAEKVLECLNTEINSIQFHFGEFTDELQCKVDGLHSKVDGLQSKIDELRKLIDELPATMQEHIMSTFIEFFSIKKLPPLIQLRMKNWHCDENILALMMILEEKK
eukprot:TRINITY_DN10382_c0_g1_i1.p1 TRINITY_DN10382_c0_g1~~TRINITY_DN10382_c0_g1_i1.p1  ORF type:complete len:210 (+),score=18.30 TRINITY_DN10382_c0_g1_i1:582-1211(+)